MTEKLKLRICRLIFGVGTVNFLVFFVVAVHLGGDAVNGKVVADHYYLASHGRYTEVNEEIFNYSRWHVYSLWVTHPLAFIAGYWYYRIKSKTGN